MTLRSTKERILQTAGYEVGGLLIAAPLYAAFFDTSSAHSYVLLICISVVVLSWAPLHNTLFDLMDLRIFNRLASDRPHKWRLIHAASLEVSSVALTLPVVMLISGHGLWQALAVNVGLTAFYAGYGYLYYLVFDWMWPVRDAGQISGFAGEVVR